MKDVSGRRRHDQTHEYCVIGNPSADEEPEIQNPGIHAIHYNAIYVPFQVDSAARTSSGGMLPIYVFPSPSP
jgi:shikimate 5-dehydrogenase